MAIISLTSAKGAPGVSTTALAMALSWPRPVILIEADVAGSSSYLAGYLQGQTPHDRGLVDLAMANRGGDLLDAIHTNSLPLPGGGTARLVPGLASPVQATTMTPAWESIAAALREYAQQGTDVIIDAGRLGTVGGPWPLVRSADLVLLTTRTNLPAVAATRASAPVLRENLQLMGGGGDVLALLLIGQGQPYTAREISNALTLPVAATVEFDPVNAEVLSYGATAPRRFQNSAFVRSISTANASLIQHIEDRQARLATPGPRGGEAPHV